VSTRRDFEPGDEGHFSVDDATGRLYWRDKAVQTEATVVLSDRQSTWAKVATGAAITAAYATIGSCVADVKTAFFSAVGSSTVSEKQTPDTAENLISNAASNSSAVPARQPH